tara:strand:- start:1231 stop:3234 length:2004 start_codon:yes stop_codon:yes gene_type:complete
MIKFNKLKLEELEAHHIRDEFVLYDSSADEYRYQMTEDEEFYLGEQLTEAQKEYLQSVGQPAESNNKIRPAVEQVLANIASASPEWDIHPVGKMDGPLASLYNELVDNIWYSSDGDIQFRKVCKDYIVKGISYFYVYPDWNADSGLGGVRFKRFAPECVYVDPNCTLPDFSDAVSIIYSDVHTKESLKVSFPDVADEIDDCLEDQDTNYESTGKYSADDIMTRADVPEDHQPKVRKYIRFTKVAVPYVLVTETTTGYNQSYNEEQYKELTKDKNYEKLLKENAISEKLTYRTHVRETCVIGDFIYYDDVLPISHYPIVPACNEHVGTPFPAGDVRHAKSPQRMLNRTEALLIAHTNATTNFKLVVEDGAIEPEELDRWNIPNAVITANPGAIREGKIKEFAPPAVSSQLYTEKQRYELDIEQVFGAYKFQQGQGQGAPGTVGEAQMMDEAIARKQNWKVLPVYDMLTKAGKIVVEWIPHVYNQQRVLRIATEYGQKKEVTANMPQLDAKTGAIERMFDLVATQVDIRVVVGSTRAKSPQADLQKDLALLNVGIYDKTQVILNMKTDVDKESLIKRHSEIAQLQSQLQGLAEENKKLQGDLQTRERELFHSNMRAEVSEATKPVAKAQAELQAKSKLEKERRALETKKVADSLQNNVSTVNSTKEPLN